jgi:hypothetical protein
VGAGAATGRDCGWAVWRGTHRGDRRFTGDCPTQLHVGCSFVLYNPSLTAAPAGSRSDHCCTSSCAPQGGPFAGSHVERDLCNIKVRLRHRAVAYWDGCGPVGGHGWKQLAPTPEYGARAGAMGCMCLQGMNAARGHRAGAREWLRGQCPRLSPLALPLAGARQSGHSGASAQDRWHTARLREWACPCSGSSALAPSPLGSPSIARAARRAPRRAGARARGHGTADASGDVAPHRNLFILRQNHASSPHAHWPGPAAPQTPDVRPPHTPPPLPAPSRSPAAARAPARRP